MTSRNAFASASPSSWTVPSRLVVRQLRILASTVFRRLSKSSSCSTRSSSGKIRVEAPAGLVGALDASSAALRLPAWGSRWPNTMRSKDDMVCKGNDELADGELL
jgi:hypothetical protein